MNDAPAHSEKRPSRSTVCRRGGRVLALLALALLLVGCGSRTSRVEVTAMDPPEGGVLLTVTTVEHDDGLVVAAPTEHALFVHRGEENWSRVSVTGFDADDAPPDAFETLTREGELFNYPRSHLFDAFRGHLWMLVQPPVGGRARLYASPDAGKWWARVALPEPPNFDALPGPRRPRRTSGVRPAVPMRILVFPGALYLVESNAIHRLEFQGNPSEVGWKTLDLDGLPFGTEDIARDALPPVLRNYLPRTEERPFELVTLLGEQLMVYRRTEPDQPWLLISTLATVDREILGVPGTDRVYLVAPDSLLRSDDQGEQWFPLWPEDAPGISVARHFAADAVEGGVVLIVGANDGSIWRSTTGGASWERVRDPDRDRRGITGLARRDDGVVLASTAGLGIVTSADHGASWGAMNQGLRAARPLDISFATNGNPIVATSAGTFIRNGTGEREWSRLHDRATSTLLIEPVSARILSGTFSGDVLVQTADNPPVVVENPFGEGEPVDFAPDRLRNVDLPQRAIVDISSRDGGQQLFAWTRGRGAAFSEDGGVTWRRIDLSDALVAALGGSVVTNFIADRGETIYLTELSRDLGSQPQLWRSNDNGESWTAAHVFQLKGERRKVHVESRSLEYPGSLFAAWNNAFARSSDAGTSWNALSGPWETMFIADFDVDAERAALLADARRHFEVIEVKGLDDISPTSSSHILSWPENVGAPERSRLKEFVLEDARFLIMDDVQVFSAVLPAGRAPLPHGVTIFVTIGIVALITGFAFLLLRHALAQ